MIKLPKDWQMIHGTPYIGSGDACVVLWNSQTSGAEGNCMLCVSGRRDEILLTGTEPFSPAHFAAGEKLLKDYLRQRAEESVKEVFRSEHITVFRREDGQECSVMPDLYADGWRWRLIRPWEGNNGKAYHRTDAEAAARRALVGWK